MSKGSRIPSVAHHSSPNSSSSQHQPQQAASSPDPKPKVKQKVTEVNPKVTEVKLKVIQRSALRPPGVVISRGQSASQAVVKATTSPPDNHHDVIGDVITEKTSRQVTHDVKPSGLRRPRIISGPTKVKVGTSKVSPVKVSPVKVSPGKVSPGKVDGVKDAPVKVTNAKVKNNVKVSPQNPGKLIQSGLQKPRGFFRSGGQKIQPEPQLSIPNQQPRLKLVPFNCKTNGFQPKSDVAVITPASTGDQAGPIKSPAPSTADHAPSVTNHAPLITNHAPLVTNHAPLVPSDHAPPLKPPPGPALITYTADTSQNPAPTTNGHADTSEDHTGSGSSDSAPPSGENAAAMMGRTRDDAPYGEEGKLQKAPPAKPTSRLVAMKNRLRQRRKDDTKDGGDSRQSSFDDVSGGSGNNNNSNAAPLTIRELTSSPTERQRGSGGRLPRSRTLDGGSLGLGAGGRPLQEGERVVNRLPRSHTINTAMSANDRVNGNGYDHFTSGNGAPSSATSADNLAYFRRQRDNQHTSSDLDLYGTVRATRMAPQGQPSRGQGQPQGHPQRPEILDVEMIHPNPRAARGIGINGGPGTTMSLRRSATLGGSGGQTGYPAFLEQIPESEQLAAAASHQRAYRSGSTDRLLDERRRAVRDGEINMVSGGRSGGGLRVTDPADVARQQPRGVSSSSGRQGASRRHTVTIGGMDLEATPGNQRAQKERRAFLDHLARKFPEHAHTIKATQTINGRPIPRRAEEQQKSKPAGPGGPYHGEGSDVGVGSEDDVGALDDLSDGGFQRGGRLRSSLPVVRSPNKTLEKPLGLVFLIYRNETKRALLPNEVTSIDTVRALFVRSFPEQLSMAYFESPKRKVYVLDQSTNVYYELEDLKDIKDRAVLKIYEKDSSPSGVRSPSRSPKTVRGPPYYPAAAAGAAGQEGSGPHSPAQLTGPNRHFADPAKAASLPAQGTFLYGPEVGQYGSAAYTASAGGQPLSPSHQLYKIPSNQSSPSRAHPLPQNSPTHRAYVINHDVIYPPPGSPSQVTPLAPLGMIPNQRHSVAYLPDGSAGFPPDSRLPQSRSYHDYYEGSSRSGSATPTASDQETTNRMDKMELQLANLAAWVQTAVVQRDGSRPGSARSNASLTSDTSARSSMSDVSSATPTPQSALSADVQMSIRTLNTRAKELKAELRTLRRLQLANAECMKETLHATFHKIKEVLSTVPGAQDAPVRAARSQATSHLKAYQDDNRRVEQDLADLEAAVEDLRSDVLNKRCRVQSGEVESMALALSNVSKALADLKGKYPTLSDEMKSVMAGEMEVVVREEKYLNHLPSKLDSALVRCKKLTRTLFTLKRHSLPPPSTDLIGGQYWLASVQEERPQSHPPVPVVTQPPNTADKRAVLQHIQAVVPDHQARLDSLQNAESLREMKRRISTNQEAMRFEKSLELAQKQLRETNNMEQVEQRQEQLLTGLIKQELAEGRGEPLIPLTDTTKRLSSNMTASAASNGKPKAATNGNPKAATNGNTADAALAKEGNGHGRDVVDARQVNGGTDENKGIASPPQKPPRTMLHSQDSVGAQGGSGNALSSSGVAQGVKVSSSGTSEGSHYAVSPAITTQPTGSGANNGKNGNNGNTNGGSIPMASFSTPARPGDSPPHWSHQTPEVGGTGKPPMPPPTCTSTPNNGTNTSSTTKNVTFSPSVTEITDISPEKTGRKVPPPPPPRRSSRSSLRVQSPQGTPIRRGVSPPAYENIENFPAKSDPSGASSEAVATSQPSGGPPPGMVMVSRSNSDTTGQRPRPMNKFQQELAEGIYANLNRPDLQNQHVNAVKVLHDPNVKEESKIRVELGGSANSDNESTASSGDSQSGTIRRNPKAGGAKDSGVTMREGKKTPPPPPIRRSSHLSKAPNVEPVKEESERPKSVHEIQQQFIQMEQQHKLQQPRAGQAQPPVNSGTSGPNPTGVWQKQNAVNGGVHNKQKMPLPAPPTSNAGITGTSALKQAHAQQPQQVPAQAPTTNGDTHSDSDSSVSVQSIVTKFSTTQTLNSQQTSKVVIQRQSVKKCEETEIF